MKLLRKTTFKSKDDFGFYLTVVALPLTQFLIFYVIVNFNSILFAFEKVDIAGKHLSWTIDNFVNAWKLMTDRHGELEYALGNSLTMYLFNLVGGVGLGLLFSYYISKEMPASGFFRVLLFMPSIISALVMSRAFLILVNNGVPELWQKMTGEKIDGLMANDSTKFGTLVFYNVLVGFGTSVLMYSNAMSAIPSEITEAGRIDGVQGIKEFWFISLPMIFSTLKTFLVAGIATIFTNQMNLFSFYSTLGSGPKMTTYGYYIYVKSASGLGTYNGYPMLSAMGLILTAVAVPLTLGIKALLDKYGPGED